MQTFHLRVTLFSQVFYRLPFRVAACRNLDADGAVQLTEQPPNARRGGRKLYPGSVSAFIAQQIP